VTKNQKWDEQNISKYQKQFYEKKSTVQIKYIPRRETRSSKIMRNKGMKALATTVPRISMETICLAQRAQVFKPITC